PPRTRSGQYCKAGCPAKPLLHEDPPQPLLLRPPTASPAGTSRRSGGRSQRHERSLRVGTHLGLRDTAHGLRDTPPSFSCRCCNCATPGLLECKGRSRCAVPPAPNRANTGRTVNRHGLSDTSTRTGRYCRGGRPSGTFPPNVARRVGWGLNMTSVADDFRSHRFSTDDLPGALVLEAGFGDLSYFNRAFRRRFGASPSDVRAAATGGS